MKKTTHKKTPIQKAMSTLGSLGGAANVKKHGNEHMKNIVRKRWDDIREKKKGEEKVIN